MIEMTDENLDLHDPALVPALRWMANMIGLWGLCAKAACRRGRACKHDPRQCLKRCAPLVPEDARDGVKAMLEGLRAGVSYDELREDLPDEVAAAEAWIARVDSAAGKRTRATRLSRRSYRYSAR